MTVVSRLHLHVRRRRRACGGAGERAAFVLVEMMAPL
jgi:hypothetical protein